MSIVLRGRDRRGAALRLVIVTVGSVVAMAGCTSHASSTPAPSGSPASSAPSSVAASGGAGSSGSAPASGSVSSAAAPPTTSSAGPPPTASGGAATTAAPTGTEATSEATPGGPTMHLSPARGAAGTIVTVTVDSCVTPAGGYTGFFADARALSTPGDPTLRHPLAFLATSTGVVTAHYTVGSKDAVGNGLFEIQCASNANATASFAVGP